MRLKLLQTFIATALTLSVIGITQAAPTTAPAPSSSDDAPSLSFDEARVAAPAPQPPPAIVPAQPVASSPPTAPLPPALIAGPITMAIAGWLSWRIRRRGNRI